MNTEEQIINLEVKEIELQDWLNTHDIDHPGFELKFRELNNIRWKIKRLTSPVFKRPKYMTVYQLPTNHPKRY